MALNAQLVSQFDGSDRAQLVEQYADDAVATTTLITGFDGGNASSSLSSITDAATLTPTLEIDSRDGDWRHLLFAVEGVEGKTPVFKLNRATMTSNSFTPTADFLPLWTQDFVTWTQATSRTLTGGTSGTIDFSFDATLPSGRVYVSTHPMGQNADAATFAAELLADYSSVAAPTTSADSSGVYNTTPTETGDDGRAVGGNDQYAIKLAWGGSTTDSGPKRKLVMFAGIHSAGEHVSWVSFVASVRHMLDATEAANFRANWDVYLYFNVTANGIVGGDRRQNPSRNIDPNRDFVDQDLQEIDELTTAILADTGGSADAQFGWHSYSTETDDFIPGTGESPNTETAAFITKGNTIFSSPRTYYLDIPSAGYRWGYDVLGAKIAFAAEVPMRGDTSVAFYEGIGENWIKTLQAIDADGVFYSSTTITASGAVQGQAIENVTLTQGYSLSVDGVAQDQAIGSSDLTQAHELSAQDIYQGNAVDSPGITQAHDVDPGSLVQGQSVESQALSQANELTPNAVAQSQAVEAVTLEQAHIIVPASLGQAQDAAAISLIQAHMIAPDGIAQTQSLGAASLAVAGDLLVSALAQATGLDVADLTQANVLSLDAVAQGHSLATVSLSAADELALADVGQSTALQAVTLTQAHIVAVSGLAQAQTVEQATLALADLLNIDAISHQQSLAASDLTQAHVLSVDSLTQAQIMQAVNFGGVVVGSLKGEIKIYALVSGGLTIQPALEGNITIH